MFDLYACIGYQSDSARSVIKLLAGAGKHHISYATEGTPDANTGTYTISNGNPVNKAYIYRLPFE